MTQNTKSFGKKEAYEVLKVAVTPVTPRLPKCYLEHRKSSERLRQFKHRYIFTII